MIEILSALGGGLLRIAPEILKWLDRKDERAHEIDLLKAQYELEQLKGNQDIALEDQRGLTAMDASAMQALVESIRDAGKPSGVRWVDALNASVRGVITYWLLALYSAAKTASFVLAVGAGSQPLVALQSVYTQADAALFSGVVSFWFVGRVWDRYVARR